MNFGPIWLRSCPKARHNLVSCGERELRGERRGKGGRSLFVTAASSFWVPLLFAGQLAGQSLRPELRLGWLASTTLVEDLLASPALRQQYSGVVAGSPRAWAAAAPVVSAGARVAVKPRVAVSGLVGWQPTQLRVEDAGGTRDVESISILHGLLEATYTPRSPVLLSAGFGVLGYRAEDRGLFSGGTELSPLVRAGAGAAVPVGAHLATLRAVGEFHRFSTPAIRTAGGQTAGVGRFGVEASFTWGGAR